MIKIIIFVRPPIEWVVQFGGKTIVVGLDELVVHVFLLAALVEQASQNKHNEENDEVCGARVLVNTIKHGRMVGRCDAWQVGITELRQANKTLVVVV